MSEVTWAMVHRIEDSAARISSAADRAEAAASRIAYMLEDGYGGNGLKLIELLEQAEQTIMDQTTNTLACKLAHDIDAVYSAAVDRVLGVGNWTPADLFGRLELTHYPNGHEIVSVDGTQVVELWPVKFDHVFREGSEHIHVVRLYRWLIEEKI